MTRRINKIGMVLIGLSLLATPALATDYSSMSTEELSNLRGTMRNTSQEEHSAFQKEWQSRVRQMTMEERQLYMGKPENRLQEGTGMQYGKYNKNKKRYNFAKSNNFDSTQRTSMGGPKAHKYGKGGSNR